MEVFSFQNTKALEARAEATVSSISKNVERLREPKRFLRINGSDFHLVAEDQNIVYRVCEQDSCWYLKLGRFDYSELAKREMIGAQAVYGFATLPEGYRPPQVTGVCTELDLVLTSEVKGSYLSSMLYKYALLPGGASRLNPAFRCLGSAIASLHSDTPVSELPGAVVVTAEEKLRQAIERWGLTDPLCLSVLESSAHRVDTEDVAFLHGNLRRQNILLSGGNICLLDFETCGAGSRYEDLSLVCANFAMTKAALVFPWKGVFSAWNEFLRGYKGQYSYAAETLKTHLLLQLTAQYAWMLGKKRVTVSGVPVSKQRLKSLIEGLRQNRKGAFPGVEL